MRGGIAQALFVGNVVKRQELIVTGSDGYAKFAAHDGSYFEVFSNSKVLFHDHPTNDYKELLNVFLGRIKVFIEHLNGPNYNKVITPTAVISVRGTEFVVDVEDDQGTTLVNVEDGIVQVANRTAPGNEPLVYKDQSIRVYPGRPLLGKLVNHNDPAYRIMRDAMDVLRATASRPSGGIGLPGAGGGVNLPGQGDKGKGNGGSGTGSTGGTQAPPSGPGAPPAGPKPGGGG
jgi:hypothetical protein